MIKFYDGSVDNRHTVDVSVGGGYVYAIQVVDKDTYDIVFIDDMEYQYSRVGDYIMDATLEEKEDYRKYCGEIKAGDLVEIVSGRKFKGEKKMVEGTYFFSYGYGRTIPYVRFTDGTSVQKIHCRICD